MTQHYATQIAAHYVPAMSMSVNAPGNFSASPTKPGRFMRHLATTPLSGLISEVPFEPLAPADFMLAHTRDYVEAFFTGTPTHLATSNWLAWNPDFVETVRHTNGSLVSAVLGALRDPSKIALSPTSGFHHAKPWSGEGFCTFSGQVIAAVRAYREHGAVGAWIDLDGHFGNSIEDSRDFVKDLNAALPININPAGSGSDYLQDLAAKVARLEARIIRGDIQYVGFAHGADSHEWDDLGHQCSTEEWIEASRIVYAMIARCSAKLGRPVPLVLSLFGGYRKDDLRSVLELHTADLAVALSMLCGHKDLTYTPTVLRPRHFQA